MNDDNCNTNNGGFFDLPPEERACWHNKAMEDTGQDFHDLDPDERARYYMRATGEEV